MDVFKALVGLLTFFSALVTWTGLLACLAAVSQLGRPAIHVIEFGNKPAPPFLPPGVWLVIGGVMFVFGLWAYRVCIRSCS